MNQLNQARDVAIGLGGRITDNESGFITCFATEDIAVQYVLAIDDLDEHGGRKTRSLCSCD